MCGIALHRYLAIVHPRRKRCMRHLKCVYILLLIIYIVPVTAIICSLVYRVHSNANQLVVFNKRIMFCSFVTHSDFRIGTVVRKVAILGGVALFIFYCYIRIYLKVRKSGQEVQNEDNNSTTKPMNSARCRREITLFKTLMVMFLSFVLCFLCISVIYAVDVNRDYPFEVYFVGVMLLWMSSSINWIIYGLLSKQYAMAYNHITRRTRLPRASLRSLGGSMSHTSNNNGYYHHNHS